MAYSVIFFHNPTVPNDDKSTQWLTYMYLIYFYYHNFFIRTLIIWYNNIGQSLFYMGSITAWYQSIRGGYGTWYLAIERSKFLPLSHGTFKIWLGSKKVHYLRTWKFNWVKTHLIQCSYSLIKKSIKLSYKKVWKHGSNAGFESSNIIRVRKKAAR